VDEFRSANFPNWESRFAVDVGAQTFGLAEAGGRPPAISPQFTLEATA
jgi:hypothetical protein